MKNIVSLFSLQLGKAKMRNMTAETKVCDLKKEIVSGSRKNMIFPWFPLSYLRRVLDLGKIRQGRGAKEEPTEALLRLW